MKKLLYITVNSKPESLSASKTVGRAFVKAFLQENCEFMLEEIDLYKDSIPRLEHEYFESRNKLVEGHNRVDLSEQMKTEMKRIEELCHQFKSADLYVIAAPMWSLSFPAPLKQYMDCVLQVGETIHLAPGKPPRGLLDNKKRVAVYVQSSGGKIPCVLNGPINKGLDYIKEILCIMGIEEFHELLVDGTGYTAEEQEEAIDKGKKEVPCLVKKIKFDEA